MNNALSNCFLIAAASLALTSRAHAALPDVGSAKTEPQFREIYQELVETNTTLSSAVFFTAFTGSDRRSANIGK